MNNLLVSVVIPTYKRSDTLSRAIDSVLAQTYKNIEIIVVDDNVQGTSESDTVKKILEQYNDNKNVIYISQEKHINGAVARNKGIEAANGELVAFLDDDDEWLPEKIERQVALLEKNPNIGGISCLYDYFKNGRKIRSCREYNGENLQFKVLVRQVAIYTSTFIGRKSIIEKFGGFDPKLIRHQDLQFFTEFLNYAEIVPINDYLVKLHIDSDINRPNTEKLIKVKQDFFDSIKVTFDKYDNKSKKRIKAAHCFEIAFSAIKQKKFITAIKFIFKTGLSFQGFRDLYCRYKSR